MPREFKVISTMNMKETHHHTILTPDERLKHFRNVMNSVLRDAQDAWADLWGEFQGRVTEGVLVSEDAEQEHFIPRCGWTEFLKRMWLLKRRLDYAQRFCE